MDSHLSVNESPPFHRTKVAAHARQSTVRFVPASNDECYRQWGGFMGRSRALHVMLAAGLVMASLTVMNGTAAVAAQQDAAVEASAKPLWSQARDYWMNMSPPRFQRPAPDEQLNAASSARALSGLPQWCGRPGPKVCFWIPARSAGAGASRTTGRCDWSKSRRVQGGGRDPNEQAAHSAGGVRSQCRRRFLRLGAA